jgi:hypothetical protein
MRRLAMKTELAFILIATTALGTTAVALGCSGSTSDGGDSTAGAASDAKDAGKTTAAKDAGSADEGFEAPALLTCGAGIDPATQLPLEAKLSQPVVVDQDTTITSFWEISAASVFDVDPKTGQIVDGTKTVNEDPAIVDVVAFKHDGTGALVTGADGKPEVQGGEFPQTLNTKSRAVRRTSDGAVALEVDVKDGSKVLATIVAAGPGRSSATKPCEIHPDDPNGPYSGTCTFDSDPDFPKGGVRVEGWTAQATIGDGTIAMPTCVAIFTATNKLILPTPK